MLGLAQSLRSRLALLMFAVALASIGIVYAYVAPSLGSSRRSQRIASMAQMAAHDTGGIAATVGTAVDRNGVTAAVRRAAALSGARVTLLGVSRIALGLHQGIQTYPIADSVAGAPHWLDVAQRAATSGRPASGTEHLDGSLVAAAARPLLFNGHVARVVVFSTRLDDVARSVALVRDRILLAGGIALALAIALALLTARALTLRIRRLQRAARRVADGDFSASFAADSRDELGELASALEAMKAQLAELDRARERFIATASHELRTPIFSLAGFLELIEDEELDEDERRRCIAQLRMGVDRLGKLATGLLDLSRLESGELRLERDRADVSEIARAVAAEFLPALGARRSHLRLRLDHEPLPVMCDAERVAQILRILIDNALTHTPAGTDVVVTAIPRGAPPSGAGTTGASISVRDYGPGIAQDAMDRIFEPFFTSDGVQGSGLGLAIARELTERMRGRLSAQSAPGRTVFTLDLPV